MNFKSITMVFVFLLFFPALVLAHPGGHGEINQLDVIPMASEHVTGLVTEGIEIPGIGKLDPSWAKIPASKGKIVKRGSGFYVVGFPHPSEKKTLYLLLAVSGNLYDVNFSGEFERLKK